jgi:hypothetical protein
MRTLESLQLVEWLGFRKEQRHTGSLILVLMDIDCQLLPKSLESLDAFLFLAKRRHPA